MQHCRWSAGHSAAHPHWTIDESRASNHATLQTSASELGSLLHCGEGCPLQPATGVAGTAQEPVSLGCHGCIPTAGLQRAVSTDPAGVVGSGPQDADAGTRGSAADNVQAKALEASCKYLDALCLGTASIKALKTNLSCDIRWGQLRLVLAHLARSQLLPKLLCSQTKS